MKKPFSLKVPRKNKGQRLDLFLATNENFCDVSRATIQSLIRSQRILVNEKAVKSGYSVQYNDYISVTFPPQIPSTLHPENISLNIIHEDAVIVVLNKPPGVVVHPSCGHGSGTLVHGLLYHCNALSNLSGEQRPGIVHRLDKDTSGVMVVAKNDKVHRMLAEQFKKRNVEKIYHAIVNGRMTEMKGHIDLPIGRHPVHRKKMAILEKGGREAVTVWRVLEKFQTPFTYIEVRLETGRTHQIRVHMAAKGHPVAGDPLYGKTAGRFNALYDIKRQCLHSFMLAFTHPLSGERVRFQAPLLPDMVRNLELLREGESPDRSVK